MGKYKFIYNPITKQLDLVNNDSSGGGSTTGQTAGVVIVDKVDTYSLLPAANGNTGNCYLVLNDQGTAWLPGSFGGTFYAKGVYYSNGSIWTLMSSVPYQATQLETDAGTVDNVFVTPLKLANYSGFDNLQTQIDNNLINANWAKSTGVISGGTLSINTLDNTKFDISNGYGYIVDIYTNPNPSATLLYQPSWVSRTGITVTNLATSTVSFVFIDKNNNIIQKTTNPTEEDLRDYIYIGQLGHSNLTNINTAIPQPSVAQSAMDQLRDLWTEIKYINDGNLISANGANLSINKTNGFLTGLGVNFENNIKIPNKKNFPEQILATIRRRTRTGGSGTNTTLDVVNYDGGLLNGVPTAISGTKAQNQRVYILPSGNLIVQYGQVLYNSLTEAIQGIETEIFVEFENVKTGQLITIISVVSNCSDLTDSNKARIKNLGKFGQVNVGAGASSVSTLQQTYTNSTTPEITTDNIRGPVSLKIGSGSDLNKLIEFLNTTGGTVSYITGQGNGLFNNVTGDTFVKIGGTNTQFLKADGSIDSNSYLTVNNPAYTGALTTGTLSYSDTGILASLHSVTVGYNQLVVQNTDTGTSSSANFIVSNNLGTATTFYGEFGINSSTFTGASSFNLPNAVYLSAISGDLVLGTKSSNNIRFVVNDATTNVLQLSTTTATLGLGTLVGTNTTQNVFNTVATTVNAFQAATTLSIGATTGTMTLRNSTIVGSGASLTLFNTTTTTMTFAGATTTLTIGGTPTTAITHNYSTNATANTITKTINFGTGGVSGSITNINIGSSVAGSIGNLSLNSSTINLSKFTSNGFVRISGGTGAVFIDTNTYLTSSDLNNYLNLTGGTLTGTLNSTSNISLNTSVTTGQTTFLTISNNNLDSLSFRYVNDAVSNILANTWQLRIGGISARRFALTYYDTFEFLSTTGSTISNSSVRIPLTTSSTNSTTGALVVSGGLGVAGALNLGTQLSEINGGTNQTTYTTGDILFASTGNTLSKRAIGTTGQVLTVSAGVPVWSTPSLVTILTANAVITEAGSNWSSNQNYVQTITLTGAAIGDTVIVQADDSVYNAILTAVVAYNILAWVSAANTVKVWSRSSGFINVPAGAKYYIKIVK